MPKSGLILDERDVRERAEERVNHCVKGRARRRDRRDAQISEIAGRRAQHPYEGHDSQGANSQDRGGSEELGKIITCEPTVVLPMSRRRRSSLARHQVCRTAGLVERFARGRC